MADIFSLENADQKLKALDAFILEQDAKEDALISILHKAQELWKQCSLYQCDYIRLNKRVEIHRRIVL